MPLYEYQCQQCGQRLEALQKFSDAPLTECEKCGGELKKLLSAPAVQFKGSGWYVTDYAGKGGGEKKEADTKAEGKGEGKSEGKKESGGEPKKSEGSSSSSASSSSSSKESKPAKGEK